VGVCNSSFKYIHPQPHPQDIYQKGTQTKQTDKSCAVSNILKPLQIPFLPLYEKSLRVARSSATNFHRARVLDLKKRKYQSDNLDRTPIATDMYRKTLFNCNYIGKMYEIFLC
jgi:hypothetical protein